MKKFDLTGRQLQILPGCIVCRTCEFMAPQVFQVPEKALTAEVLQPAPPAAEISAVLEAIRACPENVIRFVKAKGGE